MRVTYYIGTPGIEKKGFIVVDASSVKTGDEVFDKRKHVKHQCKKK